MPTATPAAMRRCRQVSTTVIRPMLAYSRNPDLGGNISSRASVVSGPRRP